MEVYSNVLLGIPDEVIPVADDLRNGWTTNKFGGVPNWIKDGSVYPQCTLCSSLLPLVAQIYCPLETSLYHRVMYLFGCSNKTCWNKNESWKVLRSQSTVENVQEKKDTQIKENDCWCDDADEWGEEEDIQETHEVSTLKQLEQQTRDLNLNEPVVASQLGGVLNQDKPCNYLTGAVTFKPYYITVVEESQITDHAKNLSRHEKKLLVEYQTREGLGDIEEMMEEAACTQGWTGEKYELSVTKHGDKIFQKFQKKVSLCPAQCLRYSWNGEPLLISAQRIGKIPCCSCCGQKRLFEMQLMPALVLLLKRIPSCGDNDFTLIDGDKEKQFSSRTCETVAPTTECIEFGTVFIYSCSRSCWSDDDRFREEYATVHSDPDQHLFKL